MARQIKKTSKSNHTMLNDDVYMDKFNEKITTLTTRFAEKVEFELNQKARYIGGLHEKNAICTIVNIVNKKSKVYYSVIFDGTDRVVNFILSTVLKKIEVKDITENENINNRKRGYNK